MRWSDWLPDEGPDGSLRWRAESDKLRRTTIIPVTPSVRAELELERDILRRAAKYFAGETNW